jgi:hypothetical protein
MFELSKSQKKAARILIDRGIDKECGQCLKRASDLLAKEEALSNHEKYLKLYKLIEKFDKQLGFRYNNLGGSKYFMTVVALYMNNVLTDEDLSICDEEMLNEIKRVRQVMEM